MDFAIRHKDWTLEDWKRVVWSYETNINCLGSDGRKWAWKRAGEGLNDRLVESTMKFGGGSVMLWGCMLWDGPGYACRTDGRMDWDLLIQDDELQESLAHYSKSPQDIIYQQDNDPKHVCKKAQEWFKNHGFTLLHSLQTLIQLSISGNTSKGGWGSMKHHQVERWNCERESGG